MFEVIGCNEDCNGVMERVCVRFVWESLSVLTFH